MKLEIPLIAAPYQKTTVVLNGQRCRISVKQMTDGVFLSLWVNNKPVKMGVICQNNVYLIKNNAFVGDLHFEDYQGFDNPDYNQIGSRFKLIYSDAYEVLPLPPTPPPAPPAPLTYTITPDVLEIRNSNDPEFITDTVIFTLETTGVSDGAVVQWRLSGDATSVNFCPYVAIGDLTIASGMATMTLIAASASYKDPAENAPFTVIVSRDGLDVCESVSISNWAWYGCGS